MNRRTPPAPLGRRTVLKALAGGLGLAVGATPRAPAADLPAGEVLLTISGRVGKPNYGVQAVFDRAMLAALPQRDFTTWTPWYPQPRRFAGPRLIEVLKSVQAAGSSLRVSATNEYQAEVPWTDLPAYDPVLATSIDGRVLGLRDKGPIFMIYDFDTYPDLRRETYFARCVWYTRQIEVR